MTRQSFSDLEILCIDDGSTDHSGDMLDHWAARDERIRVVHTPNGGYGKAVNLGISLAKGEYLGIVEPDDFIDERMYEKLYAAAKESGADMTGSDFFWYYGECNFNANHPEEGLFSHTGTKLTYPRKEDAVFMIPSIWSSLYRLAWLNKKAIRCQETPGASYQDTGFCFKACVLSNSICLLGEPLYYYRQTNPDASTKHWGKKVDFLFGEAEHLWATLPEIREDPSVAGMFFIKAYSLFSLAFHYAPKRKLPTLLKRATSNLKQWYAQAPCNLTVFNATELGRFNAMRRSPLAYVVRRLRGK